jgi:hypothetical protein
MIVFFLAEDPETGRIIDDAYLPGGENVPGIFASKKDKDWFAERRSRDLCGSFKLRYIDSDGPYSRSFWLSSPKPRSEKRPPDISPEKWNMRLKSTDELKAYKAGLQAGRAQKDK